MLHSAWRRNIARTERAAKFERGSENPVYDEEDLKERPSGTTNNLHDLPFLRIRNLQDYLNNERGQIDVKVTPVPLAQVDSRWIGATVSETIQINFHWLRKIFRLFLYFLIGIVVFESVENWSFRDSVYFIIQTFTTLGYGNITPTTKTGKVFTIFYLYVGILLAFSMINEATRFFVVFLRSKYKKPKRLNKLQVLSRRVINLFMWLCVVFLLPLVGALVFKEIENWSWLNAYYFAVVTATSLGYGDLNVHDDSGVWFNCFFIILSVSITALALDKISSFKRHLKQAEYWQMLEEIKPSKKLINAINQQKGKASRAEYLLHMLQLEGKLDYEEDIQRWDEKFEEFDTDKDGYLTMFDVEVFERAQQDKQSQEEFRRENSVFSSHQSSLSIIAAFTDEAKDVFLETIGLKTEDRTPSISLPRPNSISVDRLKSIPRVTSKTLYNLEINDDNESSPTPNYSSDSIKPIVELQDLQEKSETDNNSINPLHK